MLTNKNKFINLIKKQRSQKHLEILVKSLKQFADMHFVSDLF